MDKSQILIVDDERYVLDSLALLLQKEGHEVTTALEGPAALEKMKAQGFDIAIVDLKMGSMDGLDLLKAMKALDPEMMVVILTGHGTISTAVEAMRAGAFDYLLKPCNPEELKLLIQRAAHQRSLLKEVGYLREEVKAAQEQTEALLGRSHAMREIKKTIDIVAQTDSTVLIQGESGTGKELVAFLMHQKSPRAQRPFIRVNCAALPEQLLESELFGHKKGSFTGATEDRKGRFLMAHQGTLLLDEIASMCLSGQAKLLRVLERGELERVGEGKTIHVDVRIIATTNTSLQEGVKTGTFREDLFYRLNVVPMTLPPLVQRQEDIPLLARHFLTVFSTKLHKPVKAISDEALEILMNYSWPGNVRELKNVIERATILETSEVLLPQSLLFFAPYDEVFTPSESKAGEILKLKERLDEMEKELLLKALRKTHGNRKKTAQLLDIDSRNLSYYLKKHSVFWPEEKRQ